MHALKRHVIKDREYNILWVRDPKDPIQVRLLLTEGIAAKFRKLGARGTRSPSPPSRFTARKGTPVFQSIGGWVGPRANLDAF